MTAPWRTGRTLGRTIYYRDTCVGMVDTPEQAKALVDAANAAAPRSDYAAAATRGAARDAAEKAACAPLSLEATEELRTAARAVLALYDRYCANDTTIDLFDVGGALEKVRAVLAAEKTT